MIIDNKALERMERGTLFRTIYEVFGLTEDGEVIFRLFARNKRTAERIRRKHIGRAEYIYIELVPKFDHRFLSPFYVD